MLSPLEELNRNRLMVSPSEVAAFETALATLSREPEDRDLPELHLVLDDHCLHHEVMFGLVHLLESFELEAQLRALLSVLPQLAHQAPEWSKILHFRILNDDAARAAYSRLLASLKGPAVESAREILRTVAEEEGDPLKSAAKSVLAGAFV